MNTNIPWALYARKSTESEDRQIQSIDDQISYLTGVAKREKLHIAEIICESKSAKGPDTRKEFKRLLNLIDRGKIKGILCWKLDRLSRNPIDSARIQWFLQTGKIKCIKASDRSYLPEDNALLFAVEQGMANQYVRDLSKNVKRGLESKAEKGWYPSIPPIGYLNSKKGEKGKEEIVVDPERFSVVRRMWDMMLTGNYKAMDVLRMATTEWKLDTPKRMHSGKKPMNPSYIYKLFDNIFYTGNFIYSNKFYSGKHQAMVTMDEYEKVQAMLAKKVQFKPKKHDFPFTGIFTCSNCGASITAHEKKKLVKSMGVFKTYTYYHCTRRVGIDDCKAPPITLKELEAQIEKLLQQNTISPEFYELGIDVLKASEGQQSQNYQMECDRQSQFVNELKRKLERLLNLLLNETISEEEYGDQKKGLERQLAIEEVKLTQIEARCADYDQLIKNAFMFSKASLDAFRNGDTKTRREVVTYFGWNQQLNNKNLCIDLHSWQDLLKNGEREIMPKIDRLELAKANNDKAEEAINSCSLLMCGLVEQVGTELKKSVQPMHIPDLSKWIETIP
jgi:DNA invertase Pin-like site-specific DNA recombinase